MWSVEALADCLWPVGIDGETTAIPQSWKVSTWSIFSTVGKHIVRPLRKKHMLTTRVSHVLHM